MIKSIWRIQSRSLASLRVSGKEFPSDSWTNVPENILQLTHRQLHRDPRHPIGIVSQLVEQHLGQLGGYTMYKDFEAVVTTQENFDVLGFPQNHPGRSKTDTYYLNKTHLLRTHASAHEHYCFQHCKTPGYLIAADVYRRDTIDKTHYSVFHQLEGARLFDSLEDTQASLDCIPDSGLIVEDTGSVYDDVHNPKQHTHTPEQTLAAARHLKRTLEYIVSRVFNAAMGAVEQSATPSERLRVRWTADSFPWTAPSYQIEVFWKGNWLELCGCGLVRHQVLQNAGVTDKFGWAFGMGLDRLAMLLFTIPDIRLFWSKDPRFLKQFSSGSIVPFRPYSKYPSTCRDLAFWTDRQIHQNEVMDVVREHASDMVEKVSLIDEFVHPQTGQKSLCYRIEYQCMDRSLTNKEVNAVHDLVRSDLAEKFNVSLR